MQAPTSEELSKVARFQVGDEVHLRGNVRWKVIRRYWSKREQRIYYDLYYERTQITTERHAEEEVSAAY